MSLNNCQVKNVDFNGVLLEYDGKTLTVGYRTVPQQKRAELLLSMEKRKGEHTFSVRQEPVFDTVGPMLDLSRGMVMTVDALKEYIDKIAALGMNMMMLYTEDIYEIEGYPLFGYMRGRYSHAELREVDDYAASLGVEVIPCIQTLGHLGTYLHRGEVPKEDASTLLVDDERSYAFIEAAIRTVRKCFRSDRIHLGMDEAAGLGRGNYLKTHPYEEQIKIFNRHLRRVLSIAEKYGYRPMIWGDMLFGDGHDYWLTGAPIPDANIVDVPENVEMVFWDYYHETYDHYDGKFKQFERIKNPLVFGGGIWAWDGILPNFLYSMKTMIPALQATIDHGVRDVIATIWYKSTDLRMTYPALAIFSEICYRGRECTEEEILSMAEEISGENRELILAVSDFAAGEEGSIRLGTAMFYGDLLLDTVCYDADFAKLEQCYRDALKVIEKYPDCRFYDYYRLAFSVARRKAEMLALIRPAYNACDRQTLKRVAAELIPAAEQTYEEFLKVFTDLWESGCKPFGYERYPAVFGGEIYRLRHVARVLSEYVDGVRKNIPELDEAVVPGQNVSWKTHSYYMNL